jgi:hypothetical protein
LTNYWFKFFLVYSKLNYVDSCVYDSECFANSICTRSKCNCQPGYLFMKGTCGKNQLLIVSIFCLLSILAFFQVEYNIFALQNFTCSTNEECLNINQLMECSSSVCNCIFGYHLDGIFCSKLIAKPLKNFFLHNRLILVPGTIQINLTCTSQYDCGSNSFCELNPSFNISVCKCNSDTVSQNKYDCCKLQFILFKLLSDVQLLIIFSYNCFQKLTSDVPEPKIFLFNFLFMNTKTH